MNPLTVMLLLLACAAWANAGQLVKHNQLTAEESAAGWQLLFDGEDIIGLRFRGELDVKQEQVSVGGNLGSRVGPREPLAGSFEYRCDYRLIGDGKALLILEHAGTPSKILARHTLPEKPLEDTWHELRIICHFDPRTGIRTVSHVLAAPGAEPVTGTFGHYQDEMKLNVWLETMPGSRLYLRNVKLRANEPRDWESIWYYAGGGVAAVLLLGLLWFRRRRATASSQPRQQR